MDPGFHRDADLLADPESMEKTKRHTGWNKGRMRRRVWAIALCLYAAAVAADIAAHLVADSRAGQDWRDPANLAVAVSAGLFWPADLVATLLLPH